MIKLNNSPIEKISFNDKSFLVKRDDLLHKDFSGNKARKFHYFLENDFPNIDTLISHGSNQSNAMYSLSVLCKLKGWKFIYYTDHIPSYLEQNPQGNYKYALENGMDLRVLGSGFRIQDLETETNELFISEGGAVDEAQYGLEILANEIKEYQHKNNIEDLKVFLPSGTGTTALYLQKFLDIEVLTTPCVGDSEYLKKQFQDLIKDELPTTRYSLPTILNPPKKFHFGKLYKENYKIWQELKKHTNIEFDLLYDPVGWQTLLSHYQLPTTNYPLLYIHQGGLIGNETMIQRYERKVK
ncbi:MAG: 1-aminocyclopropane-1-carboxylate deaminase [Campylobacterota bacterium]|nr:1-aminocyclopropane-1-carboxylate deaminase [Campylobacterota bacterium]